MLPKDHAHTCHKKGTGLKQFALRIKEVKQLRETAARSNIKEYNEDEGLTGASARVAKKRQMQQVATQMQDNSKQTKKRGELAIGITEE